MAGGNQKGVKCSISIATNTENSSHPGVHFKNGLWVHKWKLAEIIVSNQFTILIVIINIIMNNYFCPVICKIMKYAVDVHLYMKKFVSKI